MPVHGPPPTPQQLASLPQWAQRYIDKIEGERNQAIKILNRSQDQQTKSTVFYDEFSSLGDNPNPSSPNAPRSLRRFVQTRRLGLTVAKDRNGDDVEIMIFHDDEQNLVEISMPRDFCHMVCHDTGRIHILHSPFDPFLNVKRKK